MRRQCNGSMAQAEVEALTLPVKIIFSTALAGNPTSVEVATRGLAAADDGLLGWSKI